MRIIGLTGNLGCGKTTVAAMFAKRGIKIIDADVITRGLLSPGGKCIKKVAKIFPGAILNASTINRSELAKIVFNNPRELQKLTDILYPEALKVVKSQISLYKNEPFVVLDVPLLFESGWDKITDTTIVVKAKRSQQIERAQKRLGITRGEVARRLDVRDDGVFESTDHRFERVARVEEDDVVATLLDELVDLCGPQVDATADDAASIDH